MNTVLIEDAYRGCLDTIRTNTRKKKTWSRQEEINRQSNSKCSLGNLEISNCFISAFPLLESLWISRTQSLFICLVCFVCSLCLFSDLLETRSERERGGHKGKKRFLSPDSLPNGSHGQGWRGITRILECRMCLPFG